MQISFLNDDLPKDNAALNKAHKLPIVNMGLLEPSSPFLRALQTIFPCSGKS
jgi:hypothetical protein